MNARKQANANMRRFKRVIGGFPCPKCGHTTAVSDSRPALCGGVPTMRRRRGCPQCFTRFTTYELIGRDDMQAILPALDNALKNARKLTSDIDALVTTAAVLLRD